MDYKKIAEMLFPNNKLTVEDIEKKYPPRNLKEGAEVTRFAPSPTGFMHIGGLFQAIIDKNIAKRSGGVYILRIEDTDKKREVIGASTIILNILKKYGAEPDEYEEKGVKVVGNYGPYFQSEREEIYKAYAKKLVSEGKAFPCFCRKTEGLNDVKEKREKMFSLGLTEDKDPCRNLTEEQIEEYLKDGKPFAIKLKAKGNGQNKVKIYDVLKGELEMQENGEDAVLLKSDFMPTYAFAHAVDDHLMRTTTVVRGEEWLPSYPLHLEIFEALGFKPVKYVHTPLIYKIRENGGKTKISKRIDAEADMRYFSKEGYEPEAVEEYLVNLANSNFELWRKENPLAPLSEFPFDGFNITANTPVFDIVKLNDISKELIAKYSAEKCYQKLLAWAVENSMENVEYLKKDKEYVIKVLNIDREKDKPRKDIYKWGMFFDYYDYMFSAPKTYQIDESERKKFEEVLRAYKNYIDLSDKTIWFDKIKEMSKKLGYAVDNKEYKKSPDAFKGNVAKVCEFIRVAVTGQKNSPDLFEIMSVLGKEKVLERISLIV